MSSLSQMAWTVRAPRPQRSSDLNSKAGIPDEEHNFPGDDQYSSARLMVSLFGVSSPGYLKSILRLFVRGFKMRSGSGGDPITVRFSIVGATGASISQVATNIFVLRPVLDVDAGMRLNPERLAKRLQSRLEADIGQQGAMAEPHVWVLGENRPKLFEGRRFHELRFGIEHTDWEETGRRLTQISNKICNLLGGSDTPISYMNFPVKWTTVGEEGPLEFLGHRAEGYRWLKIGVGLPFGIAEVMELQVAAQAIATESEAILALHNAGSTVSSLAQRFETVYAPASANLDVMKSAAILPDPTSGAATHLEADEADHIFFDAPGAIGLMGEVFGCLGAEDEFVLGALMTVVQGRTVSALVLPQAESAAFETSLRELVKAPERSRVARFSNLTASATPEQVLPSQDVPRTVWIYWWAPDEMGVLHSVIRQADIALKSLESERSHYLIESFISRVLQDDRTSCVGKMKISVSTDTGADLLLEVLASRLEAAFSRLPGQKATVRVEREEPVEEPWGSLALPD